MSNAITDAAYAAWAADVRSLGGIPTAWPYGGPEPVTDPMSGIVVSTNVSAQYGQPAARFASDLFATLAGQTLTVNGDTITIPMVSGVQFTVNGEWVYVLASSMTGSTAVDNSAQAMTQATQAEAEMACAAAGNCPIDWEGEIYKWGKIGAIGVGAVIALKILKEVT